MFVRTKTLREVTSLIFVKPNCVYYESLLLIFFGLYNMKLPLYNLILKVASSNFSLLRLCHLVKNFSDTDGSYYLNSQSEKRKQDLLAEIVLEEQRGRELSKTVKELLPDPKKTAIGKPSRARKVLSLFCTLADRVCIYFQPSLCRSFYYFQIMIFFVERKIDLLTLYLIYLLPEE
jgi:hypothetical protein